jgi:ABC-type transporter Mla subunit MlaD
MRLLAGLGVAVAVIAVALTVALTGGSDPYVIEVKLADAAGLKQQSPVMIGGIPAGTVEIGLAHGDQVIAKLNIDRSQAPVGRDASVAIAAVNFLGQKEAVLTRGNTADPAPSGYSIPAARVTVSTDLDQVLDVLDASTRARLAILVGEAGTALTGRRVDLSTVLGQLPRSLSDAQALLAQLVGDNHTLGHLVSTSDQFLTDVNGQRTQLGRLVGTAGQAAVTVAARRAQLAAVLARAPGTLATLQSFLAKLKATTVPLGPTARNLAVTAPIASQTLAQVDPFVRAAAPTLNSATRIAPALTQLATGATPVLARANPTVASLASFSSALKPISATLDHSVDNILAVVDNWSRAIQFRDGLSHVFRGEASITADVVQSLVNRMIGPHASHAARRGRQAPVLHLAAPGPAAPASAPPTAPPEPHESLGSTVNRRVGALVGGLLGAVSNIGHGAPPPQQASSSSSVSTLLNYLLGR